MFTFLFTSIHAHKTDCFLNIAGTHSAGHLICPFCNTDSFTVKYTPSSQTEANPVKNTPDKLKDILVHKSTIGDRMQVEAEIRTQRTISTGENYSAYNPHRSVTVPASRSSVGNSRGQVSRQSSNASSSLRPSSRAQAPPATGQDLDATAFSRLHDLISGSGSQNVEDIEELMLLEVDQYLISYFSLCIEIKCSRDLGHKTVIRSSRSTTF